MLLLIFSFLKIIIYILHFVKLEYQNEDLISFSMLNTFNSYYYFFILIKNKIINYLNIGKKKINKKFD